jgi:hypothetical protein
MVSRSVERIGGLLVALAFVLALPSAVGASSLVVARSARSERLAVDARLHYVNARGSYLFEEGRASGPLAGVVKATIKITADISGSFTFYPRVALSVGVARGSCTNPGFTRASAGP